MPKPTKGPKKTGGTSAGNVAVKGAMLGLYMASSVFGKVTQAESLDVANKSETIAPVPDLYEALTNPSLINGTEPGIQFLEMPSEDLQSLPDEQGDVDLDSLDERLSVDSDTESEVKETEGRTLRGSKKPKKPSKPKVTNAPTTSAPVTTEWDEPTWVAGAADSMASHGYNVPANGESVFLTFEVTNPATQKLAFLFGGLGVENPYSFTVGIDSKHIYAINIGAKYPRFHRPGNPFDGSVEIACLCYGNYMARAEHDGQQINDPSTGSYAMMNSGPILAKGKVVVELYRDSSGDINLGINGINYSPKVLNGQTVDPPSFGLETTAFWDPNYIKTADGKKLDSLLEHVYVKASPGMKVSYSTEDPRSRRRLSI